MYLTEKTLYEILKTAYPNATIEKQYKIHKYRYDYCIPQEKILVEFDGYIHYNSVLQQHTDVIKNNIALEHGFRLIRIPYFVQPSTEFFEYYFDKSIDFVQVYDHGFISPKALVPLDFNINGMDRFSKEMDMLHDKIKNDINISIKKHKLYNL